MVTVPKSNGKIRICVDLTKLNENVCRETYPLPKIDALLGEIGKSTAFTKIDAGEASRKLSTPDYVSDSLW